MWVLHLVLGREEINRGVERGDVCRVRHMREMAAWTVGQYTGFSRIGARFCCCGCESLNSLPLKLVAVIGWLTGVTTLPAVLFLSPFVSCLRYS